MDANLIPPTDPLVQELLSRIVQTQYNKELGAACGILWTKQGWVFHYNDIYLNASPEGKREFCRHEAGHIVYNSMGRKGIRDHDTWAAATDLTINHTLVDIEVLEREGYPVLTFAGMGLNVMSAEAAYENLIKNKHEGKGACGYAHLRKDLERTTDELLAETFLRMGLMDYAGSLKGHGSGWDINVKQYPDWLKKILPQIRASVCNSRKDRVRTYAVPSRRITDAYILTRGRKRKLDTPLQIMLDMSGSIGHELLATFMGAILACPELTGTVVYPFDCAAHLGMPAGPALLNYLRSHAGGGTAFTEASKVLNIHVPVVWLTDGYSGDGMPKEHLADEFWIISTDASGFEGRNVVRVHET